MGGLHHPPPLCRRGLKCHVENLTSGQGYDLIRKGHVAYQPMRVVVLNTSMVFSSLYLVPIKRCCRKTVHGDLSWPEMTLKTWRGVTGRNIPTQGVNSTCNLMFESVSNGYFQNWRLSFFFHWLIIISRGRKIDLTLGHRYQNWEINIS